MKSSDDGRTFEILEQINERIQLCINTMVTSMHSAGALRTMLVTYLSDMQSERIISYFNVAVHTNSLGVLRRISCLKPDVTPGTTHVFSQGHIGTVISHDGLGNGLALCHESTGRVDQYDVRVYVVPSHESLSKMFSVHAVVDI